MTEGLGAALAGVTSLKSRDLEDEEGPGRRIKNWKSRWVWLEPRGSHAGGEGASHTALAGCWEFGFPSKGLCRSWGLIMGKTGQPSIWGSTERFSPAGMVRTVLRPSQPMGENCAYLHFTDEEPEA